MAHINLLNVSVLEGASSPFLTPFKFEITFECIDVISEDIEFQVTYVGSAHSQAADQVLDSVLVGPVPLGVSRIELEVPAPDPTKIHADDLLGPTAGSLLAAPTRDCASARV
jgi:histone chaperone ASF1